MIYKDKWFLEYQQSLANIREFVEKVTIVIDEYENECRNTSRLLVTLEFYFNSTYVVAIPITIPLELAKKSL